MKRKNGYTFKSVILCVLFIAIVVCISIWIFKMRLEVRKNSKLIESASSESKLNVSTNSDKEFSKNIKIIKEAALKYFDSETLPKEIGSSSKITLRDMIDKKLLNRIENQSNYDLEQTYVKVTKTSNEYVIKVYLKGVKKSTYNIYYYGNYEYCLENTLCEKNEKGSNEYYIRVSESEFNSSSNTSSDISSDTSLSSSYNASSNSSSSSYTYKASSSNKSSSSASKSSGTKKVKTTTTTTVSKGATKKKTTITTKITTVVKNVVNTIKTEITSHTKNESKEENKKDKECKDEDIYEYHKSTSGTSDYTNWSDWTKDEIKPTATREVQKKTTKKLVAYKVTTSKDTSKPIYQEKDVIIGYKNTKTCTTYNEITTTTTTKTTRTTRTISASSITSGNTESIVRTGDSSYGRNNGYKLLNTYDYYCGEVCVHGTTYVFKKDVKVPVNTTSTTSSGTVKKEYTCANYETYQTPVVSKRKVIVDYENKEEKEPIYEYNYYYRYRDIKTKGGASDTKWSHYNDTNLLNNGYKYTGNKKTNTICK